MSLCIICMCSLGHSYFIDVFVGFYDMLVFIDSICLFTLWRTPGLNILYR